MPDRHVDPVVLDLLVHHGCFVADNAFFAHCNDASAIAPSDGSSLRLTGAEMTEVQVRAVLRNLLVSGLIEARPLEEMQAIFLQGVSSQ